MKIFGRLAIPDVIVFEPEAYSDERGSRFEGHRLSELGKIVGHDVEFVVSNVCYSLPHTLRGMHHQTRNPQGKLVRCLQGAIFDAVVDMRLASPTYGQWTAVRLNDVNRRAVWIPPGFAHGFLCGNDGAIVHYECTTYFDEETTIALLWNDTDIGIKWPIDPKHPPILSMKDRNAPPLARAA